jgi:hypothetical protein
MRPVTSETLQKIGAVGTCSDNRMGIGWIGVTELQLQAVKGL